MSKGKIAEVKNLPPGYRMTELGPLPKEWKVVRLGDEIIQCKEKNKNNYSYPVYTISNTYGFIPSEQFFDKQVYSRNLAQYKIVKQGSFAYNPYRVNVGSIALFTNKTPGLVSPAYIVFKIKSENRIFPPFLLLILKSDKWLNEIRRIAMSRGSVRRNLSFKDLSEFLIPLPPLPEQRAIAYVLRRVQEAKEKTENVINALKELKRSLMKHLFTYGPVPIDKVDRVKLKETEIGRIPEHWEVVRLGDLLNQEVLWIKNGFPQGSFNEEGKGVPHLRPFNINNIGGISLHQIKYVDPPPDNSPYWLQKGDIIFNNTNSENLVGKVAYFDLDGEFVLSNHMTIIRVRDSKILNGIWLTLWFLHLWYKGFTQTLARRHVNQASISLDRLKSIPIPLPPLPEQKQIAHILRSVDEKIESEKKRLEALEKVFKALLNDLMTAKRRVPEEFIDRFRE